MANILVCLATWLCFSARTTTDKIMAIVLPVAAFVAAGFEHSIANMYSLPLALLIKFYGPAEFWQAAGRTPAAYAHDETMHPGKPTHGVVDSIAGDHLTLKTDGGQVAVTLTEKTTVERGEKVVGRDALQVGRHVDVFGTKLPGGELVAREVHLDEGAAGREHQPGHAPKH